MKRYRYSGIIVAALLAVSAVNMPSAMVKAANEIKTESESKSDSGSDSDIIDVTKLPKNKDTDDYEVVPNRHITDALDFNFTSELSNPQNTKYEIDSEGNTGFRKVINLNVKYKDGLTWEDINNFVRDHSTVSGGSEPISRDNYEIGLGKGEQNRQVKLNEDGAGWIEVYQGLKPNTWYHFVNRNVSFNDYFQPEDNVDAGDIAPTRGLIKRLSERMRPNNGSNFYSYDDYIKTDSLGQLPGFTQDLTDPDSINVDGTFVYDTADDDPCTYFEVKITNDKDALDVPVANKDNKDTDNKGDKTDKSKNTDNKGDNTDKNKDNNKQSDDSSKNKSVDNKASDDEDNNNYNFDTDPNYNYTDTENSNGEVADLSSQTAGTDNSSANKTQDDKTNQSLQPNTDNQAKKSSKTTTNKNFVVVRQSFVYDQHGKLVRSKTGRHLVLKRFTLVKNVPAKKVTINGQEFYKIGKNKYIRATNTKPSSKVKRVILKAKNIKVYNSKSKSTYVGYGSPKTIHWHFAFDKGTKKIKGRLYYRVAGSKNIYIRVKDVKRLAVK